MHPLLGWEGWHLFWAAADPVAWASGEAARPPLIGWHVPPESPSPSVTLLCRCYGLPDDEPQQCGGGGGGGGGDGGGGPSRPPAGGGEPVTLADIPAGGGAPTPPTAPPTAAAGRGGAPTPPKARGAAAAPKLVATPKTGAAAAPMPSRAPTAVPKAGAAAAPKAGAAAAPKAGAAAAAGRAVRPNQAVGPMGVITRVRVCNQHDQSPPTLTIHSVWVGWGGGGRGSCSSRARAISPHRAPR